MKATMDRCTHDPILEKVLDDFKLVKKIVEDSKRHGWKSSLPTGFHLIQDVETRFGIHFSLVKRFIKASDKAWSVIIITDSRSAFRCAFESIENDTSETGIVTSYPTIEAIIDAFHPKYEVNVDFQKSDEPMLFLVLPSLQHCIRELSRIEHADSFQRKFNRVVLPSLYSMRLCGAMKGELEKIEIHDLWLVSCFLYPYLRTYGILGKIYPRGRNLSGEQKH